MSALREQHSAIEVKSAKRAWTALCEAVASPPLLNKTYAKVSPSETRSTSEEWCSPREDFMEEEWTARYENIRMELGRTLNQTLIGGVDAVDMLKSCRKSGHFQGQTQVQLRGGRADTLKWSAHCLVVWRSALHSGAVQRRYMGNTAFHLEGGHQSSQA